MLEKEGLSFVQVIGVGRIAGGVVVTAAVKGALVKHLQEIHGVSVLAFGDSQLDLEMLKEADQAYVLVGEEHTRSKTMDKHLLNAIDHKGLRARQILLPSTSPLRLDTNKLPQVKLTDPEIMHIFCRCGQLGIQVIHANQNAARVLMSPMRNAQNSGPALRESHRQVGWYLAIQFLPEVIGLEEFQIQHVQGTPTSGYRILNEKQTTIVALMRGGEPMAIGVNDALALAMFVHAKDPEDLELHHLKGQHTVILVDSVVNNGKTVIEFVKRVRKLNAVIRIIVVTGVAQTDAVSHRGKIAKELGRDEELIVIALRLSDNKYTGSGGTDTGNRLFNTTHLA